MEVHQITLPTGIQLPQCTTCRGPLFCRDVEVKHRILVEKNGNLSMNTSRLPQEVFGQGVHYCNITCAHCLQHLNREVKA